MTKNHLVLTLLILTIQTFTAIGQECKKLGDGEYFFKHKTKENRKADFGLIIKDDKYTIIHDGQEKNNGTIEWWADNCMFRLNSDIQVKANIDSLDSFSKTIYLTSKSYGGSCYEMTNGNKFRLTYCGNLHITKSEGRIIKKGR